MINAVLAYSCIGRCDTGVTWDSRDVLLSQRLKQLGVVSDGPVGPPEGLGGAEPLHKGIYGLGHLLVELGHGAVDGLHVCSYLLQQAPALREQHCPCRELEGAFHILHDAQILLYSCQEGGELQRILSMLVG